MKAGLKLKNKSFGRAQERENKKKIVGGKSEWMEGKKRGKKEGKKKQRGKK